MNRSPDGRRRARRAVATWTTVVAVLGAVVGGVSSAASASTPPNTLSIVAGNGSTGAASAGPATSTPLGTPAGVALDSSGNLYIPDDSDAEVYKVTPSGTLSVFAGTGSRGQPVAGPATASPLHYPKAVAVDSSGNVYIADDVNPSVVKVTPGGTLSIIAGTGNGGTPVPGPATSSPLGSARGVAVDSSGNVYIADRSSAVIEKVTPGGVLSIFAGNGTSGTTVAGAATSTHLNLPVGVGLDSSGNLYVTDVGNSQVYKVTPGGALSIIAGTGTSATPKPGPATSSPLQGPTGVAVDSSGNLYIADMTSAVVAEVSTNGILSIIAGTGTSGTPVPGSAFSSPLYSPRGVALNSSGNLYIADYGASVVEYVAPATSPGLLATATATTTATLNGYDQQVPTAQTLTVQNRGGGGWNVSVTANGPPSTATSPARSLPAQIITGGTASSASSPTAPAATCNGTGCTTPSGGSTVTYPITVPSSGTATIISSGTGTGTGTVTLPFQIWTTIPATTTPGTFSNTLTLTTNYGP